MQQEHSAGILVYRFDGGIPCILLLHYTAGHWDFPKGHLEQGETPEQAARRELSEETGMVEVKLDPDWRQSLHYIYTAHGRRIAKQVDFFLGETNTTDIQLSHEHQGFAWLPPAEALDKLTFENAKQLLRLAPVVWKRKQNVWICINH